MSSPAANLIWRLKHPFHINQVLDPDFDDVGGELTLKQVRDPVWAPSVKSGAGAGDPWSPGLPRRQIERRVNMLARRQGRRRRELDRLVERFHGAMQQRRQQLDLLVKRFHRATLQGYPKFRFGKNQACNACVPYNGRHTANYWATGQVDCW